MVSAGPRIGSFTASADFITLGDPIDLAWTVQNDASGVTPTLTLTDDQGGTHDVSALNANADSYSFTPSAPGTYVFTLTADTPGTTAASATATVVVAPVPRILSLEASPSLLDTILGIDRSMITWTSEGGASAWLWELDAGGASISPALWQSTTPGEIAAFGLQAVPTATTTYRLEVWNAAGATTTAEVTVRVDELGFISTGLAPAQIVAGESATLSWQASSQATSVSVNPTPGMLLEAPTGAFQDISTTGTEVTNLTTSDFSLDYWDEGVSLVSLPFAFPFYGESLTQVVVTTNGYLAFDAGLADPLATNPSTFPSTGAPHGGFIAPFWDDLDAHDGGATPGAPGTLYTQSGTDANGNYFVVQWTNYLLWSVSPHGDLNFQVWIWEDGSIEVRYGTMTSASNQAAADGSSATIGVESVDGTTGHAISVNTAAPGGLSNTGWRLSPASFGTADTHVVSPSASTDYQLCASDGTSTVCETLRLVVVKPGDVMVSELMLSPVAAPVPDGQWIELSNTSAETLDLSGWILGDGTGSHTLSPGAPLLLAPGALHVLAFGDDPALNGGITGAEAFGSALTLSPAGGSLTLSCSTLTVDAVTWDGTWTFSNGAALQAGALTPGDPASNDGFTAWCDADTPYGDGDLGTPGAPNSSCP
ncbi:MAG: lamin tail domain-containing protein [Deltaproteobacteria bacterium]|nr:lamin tail domain-containing protein [Deltaproteobacteria bacterium]